MSRGWGIGLFVLSRGEGFCAHLIVPGEGVVIDEIDTYIIQRGYVLYRKNPQTRTDQLRTERLES